MNSIEEGPDRSTAPTAVPSKSFNLPPAQTHSLGKGRTLVTMESGQLPLFHATLLHNRGLLQEGRNEAGHHALVASLLCEGTKQSPGTQLAAKVEAIGGQLSAGCGWETTALQLTGHLAQAGELWKLMIEAFEQPTFDPVDVDRQRSAALAALTRMGHQAAALAEAALGSGLRANRLAIPALGSRRSLNGFDRKHCQQGWSRIRNAPRAALFVAAGQRLTQSEHDQLIASPLLSGDTTSSTSNSADSLNVGFEPGPARIRLVDLPQASQAELRIGHLGPSRGTACHATRRLLNAVLGGQFTSRLNLRLRERYACTYGVSSGFTQRLDDGSFRISAAVEVEQVAQAIRGCLEEMRLLQAELVTESELDAARQYLIGVQPFRFQTLAGLSGQRQTEWLYGLGEDSFVEENRALLEVDRDQVMASSRAWLSPDEACVSVAGPASSVRAQLADVAQELRCSVEDVNVAEVMDPQWD